MSDTQSSVRRAMAKSCILLSFCKYIKLVYLKYTTCIMSMANIINFM